MIGRYENEFTGYSFSELDHVLDRGRYVRGQRRPRRQPLRLFDADIGRRHLFRLLCRLSPKNIQSLSRCNHQPLNGSLSDN